MFYVWHLQNAATRINTGIFLQKNIQLLTDLWYNGSETKTHPTLQKGVVLHI